MVELARVAEQIESAYAGLSPQLQRAARYVLDSPDDVALGTIRDVATQAGVHPSTLVRLARELAFSGYAEFREPFRERLRTQPTRYADRAKNLQARGRGTDAEILYQEIVALGRGNIEQTFADTSPEQLSQLADDMESARRVFIVGLRKCFPIAFYLQYACRMFHDDVVLLSGWAGTLVDELRDLGRDDVLIAISFDPYTRETVHAARYAASAGAKLVAITDSQLSPLAEGASHTFVVTNSSTSFFRSLVAAMALAEAIVAFLLARGGDQAITTLADMEDHLDLFEIYLQRRAPRVHGRSETS